MSSKKILVVFGATGKQGGSVIKAVLQDPVTAAEYQVHGITRDPSKPAAIALAKQGVTVLKGDLDDKESLRLAMKDAYAVFGVTNFFELMNKDREILQGKNIADIAKELDVKHLIWSSLPHVSKLSDNKLTKVIHFDGKAIVEEYMQSLRIPATFLLLGIYMSFLGSPMLRPISAAEPKKYKLSTPMEGSTKLPMISVVSSTGQYVKAILQNREKVLGKQICAAQDWYSLDDVAAIMRKGGLDVTVEKCTDAEYRADWTKMGTPELLQDDFSDAMKFFAGWGFYGRQDGVVERGHEILSEPLETFSGWVETGGLDYLK